MPCNFVIIYIIQTQFARPTQCVIRISYPGSRGTMKAITLASFIFVLVYVFECRRLAKEQFRRTEVGEMVSLQLMKEGKSRKISAVKIVNFLFCFWCDVPPPVGQGLLIHEVSRSHTTTYHSR